MGGRPHGLLLTPTPCPVDNYGLPVDNYAVKVVGYYLSGAVFPLELFTIHSLTALALQGLALPVTYQLPVTSPVSYRLPNHQARRYPGDTR